MTTNERSALSSLLVVREQTRESAERAWVAARRDVVASEEALVRAGQDLESHRTSSNEALDAARSTARLGADFVAVDSLARAIRDESKRLLGIVEGAESTHREALRAAERARDHLAHAEADAKAVGQRIEAAAARDRSLALAREDDEADERAAERAHRPRD